MYIYNKWMLIVLYLTSAFQISNLKQFYQSDIRVVVVSIRQPSNNVKFQKPT